MKILPRFFGLTLLLTSLILGGKLVYDATIFHFWTTPWVIGVIATLVLIAAGLGLLFLESDETAYSALTVFGCIYVVAAAVVYVAWGIKQVFNTGGVTDFFGYASLFIAVTVVATTGLLITATREKSYGIFLFPAWVAGVANLAIIFSILFKYIFAQKEWYFWSFIAEMIILVIGAGSFLGSYELAKTETTKK